MASEHTIARYRHWYKKLLSYYAQPYHEQFAEGMEQTFNDVCRERAKLGKGLFGFVLWMFVETSAAIVLQYARHNIMHNKNIVRIAIGTALLLLIPLYGNYNIDGWNWGFFDFVFMGALVFGTGLAFELVARKGGTLAYRIAVGIGCVTGFLLLWINAAVGFIGDGPVNLLYLGVLAIGFIVAFVARFQPRGMALALCATAVAQMVVPVIALAIWKAGWLDLLTDSHSPHGPFSPGVVPVFLLNAVFAALWLASALLFWHSSRPSSNSPDHETGRVADAV